MTAANLSSILTNVLVGLDYTSGIFNHLSTSNDMKTLEFCFQSFWHFVGCLTLLYVVAFFTVNGCIKFCTRFFRMIMVLSRGWPPKHLDADGDWQTSSSREVNPMENI